MDCIDCELKIVKERDAEFRFEVRTFRANISLDEQTRDRLNSLTLRPKEFGKALFETVFVGDILQGYRAAKEKAGLTGLLRIRLNLWNDSENIQLHQLNWELLYDPLEKQTFGHWRKIAFSRFPSVGKAAVEPLNDPKLLVVISCPSDAKQLGLAEIDRSESERKLREALKPLDNLMGYEFLPGPATVNRIREQLSTGNFHALHIQAHGVLGQGQASLLLQKEDDTADYVSEETFSQMFSGLAEQLRLVTLITCQGGQESDEKPLTGLAGRLVTLGIPAVIAMQKSIAVQKAGLFTQHFYQELGHHGLVDVAVTEARHHLALEYTETNREWSTPVLFMRLQDGRIWNSTLSLSPQQEAQIKVSHTLLQQVRLLVEGISLDTKTLVGFYQKSAVDPLLIKPLTQIGEILVDLWEQQPRTAASVVPLLEFVARVGKLLEDTHPEILAWVKDQVSASAFQKLEAEWCLPPEKYDFLFVEVPSLNPKQIEYRWFKHDGWLPAEKLPCEATLEGVKQVVFELVAEAEQNGNPKLVVEFLVPASLLTEQIEFWEKDVCGFGIPAKLAELHRVHLRWLERAKNDRNTRPAVWKYVAERIQKSFQSFQQPDKRPDFWIAPSTNAKLIMQKISQEPFGVYVGLEAVPQTGSVPHPHLAAALVGGAPYILWSSQEIADWEGVKQALHKLAKKSSFEDLPIQFNTIRNLALVGDSQCAEPRCASLTIFWDDPMRNPFDPQLTQPA